MFKICFQPTVYYNGLYQVAIVRHMQYDLLSQQQLSFYTVSQHKVQYEHIKRGVVGCTPCRPICFKFPRVCSTKNNWRNWMISDMIIKI